MPWRPPSDDDGEWVHNAPIAVKGILYPFARYAFTGRLGVVMRAVIFACFFGFSFMVGSGGLAAEKEPLTDAMPERKLLTDAPLLKGRTIRVDDIGCVDPGGVGGFKCLKKVGGQLLLIDANLLGAYTAQEIAEDLIGDCKGTANIASRKCLFTVEFDLQSSQSEMIDTPGGSLMRVTLYTRQIDFYRVRSKRR